MTDATNQENDLNNITVSNWEQKDISPNNAWISPEITKSLLKDNKKREKEQEKYEKKMKALNREPTIIEKTFKTYWVLITFFWLSAIFTLLFYLLLGQYKDFNNTIDLESADIRNQMEAEKTFLDNWAQSNVKIVPQKELEAYITNVSDAVSIVTQFTSQYELKIEKEEIKVIVKKKDITDEKISLLILKLQAESFPPRLVTWLSNNDTEVTIAINITVSRKSLKEKEEEKLKKALEEKEGEKKEDKNDKDNKEKQEDNAGKETPTN